MTQLTKKEFYKPIQQSFIEQSGLSPEVFSKEVSFAMQHVQQNATLNNCDPNTMLRAVLNVAQTGLTLNPVSKYAYLVPRYNGRSKQMEVVLEPGYMGLVKLLTDSGSVKSLESHIIYEGDEIDVDLGSEKKVKKHIPHFLRGKEKGKIIAVYSLATLQDGSYHCEIMSANDVNEIKEKSESYKSYQKGKITTCIWVDHEPEMYRKTVLKRHFKYLPKTDQSEKLQNAIEIDNINNGFDEPISETFIGKLESMIDNSLLSEEKKEVMREQLGYLELKSHGVNMANYLSQYEPEMGYHSEPKSSTEAMKATANRTAREK